jgi:LPS export ABC transporter protein LptC
MPLESRHSASPAKIRRRAVSTLPCFVLLLFVVVACRNDMEKVRLFDPQNLPQQSIDTVRALRSLGGKKQMVLKAPKVVVYEQPERKTVYPDGIDMQIYNNGDKIAASIKAKYAQSLDEKKIIEARNDVVIIDFRSGDTSYLENIVWNSAEHRIFSNAPVKSVNGKRVTYGDGFESDDEFTTPRILHQRGTMTIEE